MDTFTAHTLCGNGLEEVKFEFHVTLSAMSITSHYNDVTENQIEIQLLNFSKLSNDSRNRMCKKPTCSPNFPL